MRRLARLSLSLLLLFTVSLAGCGSSSDTIILQGAGATFPAPVYKRWLLEYYLAHPNTRVSYQPIGSGAGVRQFLAELVDFGASDAAMTDDEIQQAKHGVLMLPLTAGSISVSYNVPGLCAPLKLSRSTLAGLFLGVITRWNDPAVLADNPEQILPDLPVRVVRRAESSGTTLAFSSHLAAISPEWNKDIGASKTVDKWKTGIGARGNAGVAATIQRTPGTVGYLETGYAKFTGLPSAYLQNKAGQFHLPTPEAGKAALAGAKLPANMRLFIPDPDAPGAYPIVTYTWVLARPEYPDAREAQALKNVLKFCLTEGQPMAAELGYIPLPETVIQQVMQAVEEIRP